MDHSIAQARAASTIRNAALLVDLASHRCYEANRVKLGAQLLDVMSELFYLERQVLDLPPQRTPAACEFERAGKLLSDDAPF